MTSLPDNYYEENRFIKSITSFLKRFNARQALSKANAYKQGGIPLMNILAYLLQLVFTKTSMYMNLVNGTNEAGFKKDVVYRFISSIYINWQKFILHIASSVINGHISKLTSKERINAIVIDDTFYGRQRSKNVELLSNVYDHASKGAKYKKGFRLLTVGWTDGNTFIPLTYGLLSSENQKHRYCEMNASVDKRSSGYKRRKQAITKSPTVMLDLLDEVILSGISAKHVLFDSWFSHPVTLIAINKKQLHTIARVKNTSKIKYLFNGEKKTLSEIYRSSRKRRGKSKYLLSVDISIYSDEDIVPAKLVYVRDRKNKKKWIALITTDIRLSEEEIIRVYGKRWSIEVFFKVSKSYLRLSKEFQGLSYDTMFAHTAIVFLRYIMLAVETRDNEDNRSLGELFFWYYEELKDIEFPEALSLILEILAETLQEVLFLTKQQVESLIEIFISKLPEIFSKRLCQLSSKKLEYLVNY
jgi:hypothetical protein